MEEAVEVRPERGVPMFYNPADRKWNCHFNWELNILGVMASTKITPLLAVCRF